MKSLLLGLLAETSIHPGCGQDVGFIDLPVARESTTDYPVIVGSSFKGALVDKARAIPLEKEKQKKIFGESDNAGSVLISDARLLLLPVRSLTSQYKWVTCPHLLERWNRDRQRMGQDSVESLTDSPEEFYYLGSNSQDQHLYLEERQFTHKAAVPDELINELKKLICHDSTHNRLSEQLVILHDNDFAWFARYGLAVNARNVLDEKTKASKNLWYEETLPPDSLFYCLITERHKNSSIDEIKSMFKSNAYMQVGGNETVGQGIVAVSVLEEDHKDV